MASITTLKTSQLDLLARRLRRHAMVMVGRAGSSHIASCLSVADILAVLYGAILKLDPEWPDWPARDRLIMSKGHAAAILYAALAEVGFIAGDRLGQFCAEGTSLAGHVSHRGVPGVEVSTGSLGHGLPLGAGMALAASRDRMPSRTFVVMSDGELDEGSNWEAILFSAHHRLENLVTVIDYNKLQSLGPVDRTIGLEPMRSKFQAFGWAAIELDGHDTEKLQRTLLSLPLEPGRPSAVIAHTVKGKGVSFMEDTVLWHYRSPTGHELTAALHELDSR
jgi:transketolase